MRQVLEKARPSENGPDGERDPVTGRFLPGNKGGPGAPFLAQVARFRRVLVEAVSEEDVAEIATRLVNLAKEGNLHALKILLPYLVGAAPKVPTDDGDEEEEKGPILVEFVSYIRPDGTEIEHDDPDWPTELDRQRRSRHNVVQFPGADAGL